MTRPTVIRRSLWLTTFVLVVLLPPAVKGFGQTIALPRPMPSYNQAYREGANAWGTCDLGTNGCPDEIWLTGCLVTAFASVLDYYGVDVSLSASESYTGRAVTGMNPGLLNDWLQGHGGFGDCSQDPYGSCCLNWSRLPGNLELTFHSNRSDVGLNPVAAVVIDHALRQGYPVIAGVHWGAFCNGSTTQSEDCHWVVLTGKVGSTYAIVDPFNPDPTSPSGVRTTLSDGVKGTYIIDRFVVVEPGAPVTPIVSPDGTTSNPVASSQSGGSETLSGLFAAIAVVGALAAVIALIVSANP